MATCSIVWRSSGGRGEIEYVPASSLFEREIAISCDPINVTIPAEVMGLRTEGKPRLRKFDANNRKKLHLPQLVMALCRLPEPRRQDVANGAVFPLQNKSFLMDTMDFDIIDDDGTVATLAPLRVSIRDSNHQINLQDRLAAIAADIADANKIEKSFPSLGNAILHHHAAIVAGVNSIALREAADRFIAVSTHYFGPTNAASVHATATVESLPESDIEDGISAKEGRLLTRTHSYKERDRAFAKKAKKYYKKHRGTLTCEVCELDPIDKYGSEGERCIEAHHKVPIQELQPDSITKVEDMAMVCASCHRVIHSRYPCLTVDEARNLISS
jgi:hypothetical protein